VNLVVDVKDSLNASVPKRFIFRMSPSSPFACMFLDFD
jgi:hypothetical protein